MSAAFELDNPDVVDGPLIDIHNPTLTAKYLHGGGHHNCMTQVGTRDL